jgi:beta-lactamase class A
MEAMIMASDNTATDMIFKVAGEYRRILTLCDYIYLIPLPLGVSAYAKSGNADVPGFHARSIAGGLFVAGRWIYFAFVLNWNAAEPDDPATVDEFFSAYQYGSDPG